MTNRTPQPPRNVVHGRVYSYVRLRCRCIRCRNVYNDYRRVIRISRPALAADDPRHGTVNGYTNLACRCEPCQVAMAAASKLRRSG